ncbi:uncharacterized protein LOC134255498 [Saccostrea cucullata]|uniref:uncharacterized protein LOC134255498 n=1 Tax=Saccostrea cuccullata TaxID=36930 RepID=UPI002ED28C64
MDVLGCSNVCNPQCKVRRCFLCKGDVEFYCSTCKHDLCLQCKEGHVIDLDTIYHDVVIYREKYENFTKQETCVRHPNRNYEKYCQSCEIPVCVQCTEHRNNKMLCFNLQFKKHRKHNTQDIKTAYKLCRKKFGKIFQHIRSETLYNSRFILAGIKTDVESCRSKISNCQSQLNTEGQRLKNLIDTVVCEYRLKHYGFLGSFKQQQIIMNRHISRIEDYEDKHEQLVHTSVTFNILFLKKLCAFKIKGTPNLSQHSPLFLAEQLNIRNVIKLPGKIHIIETGKRQLRFEMTTPMLRKSITVEGVSNVDHISCVASDRVWISDWYNNLILTSTEGEKLHHLTNVLGSYTGIHTVNRSGELIYTDKEFNINTFTKDMKTMVTLIKKTEPWKSQCVYCSPINGDLLVGMYNSGTEKCKVNRYNNAGQHIQTIQYNMEGQELYRYPVFITENRNGDIVVSDSFHAVVVTDCMGRHRFSIKESSFNSGFMPSGICTDALSHILVCDYKSYSVLMINEDGIILPPILTVFQLNDRPQCLSYDHKSHLLWVGLLHHKVCAYRYFERQNYL